MASRRFRRFQLLLVVFTFVAIVALLHGCAVFFTYPQDTDVDERLSAFPSSKPWPINSSVTVYWHERMIPFVEADNDADGAFAIGVVHAHLRLGQMEMFRRLSAGRVAEMGGPIGLQEIDKTVRTLNLERSAQESLTLLNTHERAWLERYVRGINFYVDQATELPMEFRFLGLEVEPWTPIDVLRLSRLGGADPNWFSLLTFLSLKDEQGWDDVWSNYLEKGLRSPTSFTAEASVSLETIVSSVSRVGSNSVVIGASKHDGDGALIASDPHLGIFVPNLWLLMGYKTPSYHVLGYMLPGTPVTVLGRNRDVAWGGTAMRAVSSHLFELAPDDEIVERVETIRRRWWTAKTITVRESKKGPIVSDLSGQDRSQPVALWWEGHQGSNELGGFLGASRAKNWQEFRTSFADYAVGGLNITYADRRGNVGMILGVRQPLLADQSEHFNLVKSAKNYVAARRGPLDLPSVYNPPQGFVASANNMPVETDPPIAFVSGESERFRRWTQLISSADDVSVDHLMRWQNDVYSPDGLALKNLIVDRVSVEIPPRVEAYWQRLKEWDGYYVAESVGAPAFELLTLQLATALIERDVKNAKLSQQLLSTDDWRIFLAERLLSLNEDDLNNLAVDALLKTRRYAQRFATWGEMHVQPMRYPLGLIPILGNRFTYFEYPAPGSSSTLNKSGLTPSLGKRSVTFGAQVRHISDMSSLDENYFVMHGGNDGWLNNSNMTDQVDAWRNGDYYRIPLDIERVKEAFVLARHTASPQTEPTQN